MEGGRGQTGHQVLATLGMALYYNGKLDQAIEHLEAARAQARGRWDEEAEAVLLCALAYAKAGRMDEAKKALAQGTQLATDDPAGSPQIERFRCEAEALIQKNKQ